MTPTQPTRQPAHRHESAPRCCRCAVRLEESVLFADLLRYWVCRSCGTWTVPEPPVKTGMRA